MLAWSVRQRNTRILKGALWTEFLGFVSALAQEQVKNSSLHHELLKSVSYPSLADPVLV